MLFFFNNNGFSGFHAYFAFNNGHSEHLRSTLDLTIHPVSFNLSWHSLIQNCLCLVHSSYVVVSEMSAGLSPKPWDIVVYACI